MSIKKIKEQLDRVELKIDLLAKHLEIDGWWDRFRNSINEDQYFFNELPCWYDDESLPQKMLDGASGKLFPKLKDSDHWPVLRDLLMKCNPRNQRTLLDMGCGAGALQDCISGIKYTGCDLPNIIDNVAKIRYPDSDFIKFDISIDEVDFISSFDIIVMNGFIEALPYPLAAFEKVLQSASKYVLCHRQKVGKDIKEPFISKEMSYNGYTHSVILPMGQLAQLFVKYNFSVVSMNNAIGNYLSFLLKKNEDDEDVKEVG